MQATVFVEELDLLRDGTGRHDWKVVAHDEEVFLIVFALSSSQTDTFTFITVSSSSVDERWMESMESKVIIANSES